MMKTLALLLGASLVYQAAFTQVQVSNLLCENLTNPIGLDVVQPRLSWQLVSDRRNVIQTAYEIKITSGKSTVWSSGKVDSDSSVHIAYKGLPLQSGAKYSWQVQVWDNTGKASAWSQPAFWQMALLNIADWKAKWIEQGFTEDTLNRPTPLFRKEFKAGKKFGPPTPKILRLESMKVIIMENASVIFI